MRTKRGGFRTSKPKQGKPRVRIRVSAVTITPKHVSVRLATVPDAMAAPYGTGVEHPRAGLLRYIRHRAPAHLWA